MKLVEAFKKNDAAMTALQRVFAAFKPIMDVINLAFTKLAEVIGKVMDGIANFVQKVASFIHVLKDYAAAEDDVVVATDNLEEAERQYTVNHAKRETEISELNELYVFPRTVLMIPKPSPSGAGTIRQGWSGRFTDRPFSVMDGPSDIFIL